MTKCALTNCRVVLADAIRDNLCVVIEDGHIAAVAEAAAREFA